MTAVNLEPKVIEMHNVSPDVFLETLLGAGHTEIKQLAWTAIDLLTDVSLAGQRTTIEYAILSPHDPAVELVVDLEAVAPRQDMLARMGPALRTHGLHLSVERPLRGNRETIVIFGRIGRYIAFQIGEHPRLPVLLFRLT